MTPVMTEEEAELRRRRCKDHPEEHVWLEHRKDVRACPFCEPHPTWQGSDDDDHD